MVTGWQPVDHGRATVLAQAISIVGPFTSSSGGRRCAVWVSSPCWSSPVGQPFVLPPASLVRAPGASAVHVLETDPERFAGELDAELATAIVSGRELLTGITARTGSVAAVNGGYFVVGPADGTPGDLAGISVLDGRLVSEAVNGRTSLVLPRPRAAGLTSPRWPRVRWRPPPTARRARSTASTASPVSSAAVVGPEATCRPSSLSTTSPAPIPASSSTSRRRSAPDRAGRGCRGGTRLLRTRRRAARGPRRADSTGRLGVEWNG